MPSATKSKKSSLRDFAAKSHSKSKTTIEQIEGIVENLNEDNIYVHSAEQLWLMTVNSSHSAEVSRIVMNTIDGLFVGIRNERVSVQAVRHALVSTLADLRFA
jgi:hypothetical protein